MFTQAIQRQDTETLNSVLKVILIHEQKTEDITTMKKVWKCDLDCHKIGELFL